MGSPLGPLFANIFISFYEKSWLHNCRSVFKPLLYRCSVGNCYLLFKSLSHVPLFLNYSILTANILTSLTSELEKGGKISFLDVEICCSNDKFSTSAYRKRTFTGLFTNFHRFIPLAYKRFLVSCSLHQIVINLSSSSLVSCSLHQISNLISSYENFHARLEVVRKLFKLLSSHMLGHLVRRLL